ncbi:dihydroxyacetone kinase-like protein [Kitasatospora sp. MAP12-15]|uniref:dihydroxyacetone kinase subunit DhaK n=1 Tax=unclassified Kitasatospora TaxID=2633591 RepID=UPI002474D42E|nr:dihydroxyacetone kinase subunit DhaK [Kitasatospora sp. MAP12-44]MDH6113210.1 dihydroxyacetone kinase-like protein [Kitasatospora sp. MAP12-44]
MKKLINSPESVLEDALTGIAAAHPELTVDRANRVIRRAGGPRPGKVAVISGGGSGHEPLHAGFVGPGMLDAACPGEIFTSPVPDQVLAAINATHAGAGVVLVVKNYTGDVLNFQLAAELAAGTGIEVRTVLVDDDVAVDGAGFTAGRRGTGATVVVEKVVGALAERGAGAAEAASAGERANAASRSFAVALTAATVPAVGRPGFELPEDQIEVGVGIHGEPGRYREPLRPAKELVAQVVDAVLAGHTLAAGDEVIALVNGLGATPLIELYIVFGEVSARLAERGIRIVRSLVGNYVTSLDMAGFSLTLTKTDPQLLDLWDAPVSTPALRRP